MFDQMKQMKQLMSLLGNADQMKQQMEAMQDSLARKSVTAEAGAGAVRVTVNGKFEVTHLAIDPVMLTALTGEGEQADKAMVEDLIAAAVNEGIRRAQELARDEMMKLTGGMGMPDLSNLTGLPGLPGNP